VVVRPRVAAPAGLAADRAAVVVVDGRLSALGAQVVAARQRYRAPQHEAAARMRADERPLQVVEDREAALRKHFGPFYYSRLGSSLRGGGSSVYRTL